MSQLKHHVITSGLAMALLMSLGTNYYLFNKQKNVTSADDVKDTKSEVLTSKSSTSTNDVEFGDIIKSIMVDIPKGQTPPPDANYYQSWELMGKYFDPFCFMECEGKVLKYVLVNGKSLNHSMKPLNFEANGPKAGFDSIKLSTPYSDSSQQITTEDFLISLKKSGMTVTKFECNGDFDYLIENNVNMPASMEWTPPSFFKLSMNGYADALFVSDFFDIEKQADFMRFYTTFAATTKTICTEGVKF